MPFIYKYPRPSVTATVVAFNENKDAVLTGLRVETADAYPGMWCIPGGFLNARVDEEDYVDDSDIVYNLDENEPYPESVAPIFEGETVRETAIREFFEETGILLEESQLKLFEEFSGPKIDPRAHVVNLCYKVVLKNSDILTPGDDISELRWTPTTSECLNDFEFAFNHRDIVNAALL